MNYTYNMDAHCRKRKKGSSNFVECKDDRTICAKKANGNYAENDENDGLKESVSEATEIDTKPASRHVEETATAVGESETESTEMNVDIKPLSQPRQHEEAHRDEYHHDSDDDASLPQIANEWLNEVHTQLRATKTRRLSLTLVTPTEYRHMDELATSVLLDGSHTAVKMGIGMFGPGANFGVSSLDAGAKHILTSEGLSGKAADRETGCVYVWPGDAHDCEEFLDHDLSDRSKKIGPLQGPWNEKKLKKLMKKLSDVVKESPDAANEN